MLAVVPRASQQPPNQGERECDAKPNDGRIEAPKRADLSLYYRLGLGCLNCDPDVSRENISRHRCNFPLAFAWANQTARHAAPEHDPRKPRPQKGRNQRTPIPSVSSGSLPPALAGLSPVEGLLGRERIVRGIFRASRLSRQWANHSLIVLVRKPINMARSNP